MLFYVYNVLIFLVLPLLPLRLLFRARKNPGYAKRIGERFGFYKQTYQKGGIVVHAVSLGETMAAKALINALLDKYPSTVITVTTTTPTGSACVMNTWGNKVQHVYLPYDYRFALNRFFNTFKPQKMIILETEWWPNLYDICRARAIPVEIANGRLSERSFHGYQRIQKMANRMAKAIKVLCAQTEIDAKYFIGLGVPEGHVHVTGNLKFDMQLPATIHQDVAELKAFLGERPIWVAASTHAPEEPYVIEAIKTVLTSLPDALCIIVPRHPERFDSVYQTLCSAGLQVARRSADQAVTPKTQVYLADTMGELLKFYGVAHVAFVGGSLAPIGGHNMLEAALMDCAIVMGSNTQNVAQQAQAMEDCGGMRVIRNPHDLGRVVAEYLCEPKEASKLISSAHQFVERNQGALNRTLNLL